jgi:hypothetical protein
MHESGSGPSRHFVAAQQFSRFRCRADITRLAADTTPVAKDPKRPSRRPSASSHGPIGRYAAGRFRVASRKTYRDQINRLIKLELWSVQTIFEFS